MSVHVRSIETVLTGMMMMLISADNNNMSNNDNNNINYNKSSQLALW
jgi:hypothetical protein